MGKVLAFPNVMDPVVATIETVDGSVEIARSWVRAKQANYLGINVLQEMKRYEMECKGGHEARRTTKGLPRRLEHLLRRAAGTGSQAVAL
ncbi:MAG: hypothetical protein P1V51_19935 [Deltaproteobacteria bacterium]|nr:hypothetical protein [Deltaproteobacteria bacterium]